MRYITLIVLLILTSVPTFADDTPEVIEVARFGRGTAYTLAWRPDGDVLAVGSSTGVWFFDEDFNELGHLQSANEIYELEWSPSGKQLVIANRSKSNDLCFTSVWKISEDFSFTIIAVPEICPESIDWSPDGNYFAVGGTVDRVFEDGHSVTTIFDSQSFIIEEYLDYGVYVAFSPDSQYLAINQDYDNQGMTILNIETDEIIQTIDSPEVMLSVSWSPDGKYIASTCNDYDLFQDFWGDCIWNVNTGDLMYAEELTRVTWHPKKLEFLDTGYSPWGGSHQSSWLRLHTTLTDEVAFDTFYIDIIHHPEWHPSGEYFVALSSQNLVSFNGITGEVVEIQKLFSSNTNLLSWIPQSNNLLSISQSGFDGDSTANVWSLDSDDMREPYEQTTIPDIDEIQWVAGKQNFVVHSYGGLGRYFVTEWNADSLEQVSELWEHFEQDATIPHIRYTDSLERIIFYWSEYMDEVVITDNLFDVFQDNNNITLDSQADRLRQIEWSPDNTIIATAGEIGDESVYNFLIEIWNAETGEPISSFFIEWLMHYDHFIWSPDNTRIAVTSNRTTGGGCEASVGVYTIQKGEFYEIAPTMPKLYWSKYCDDPIFYSPEPQASWSPDGGMIAVSFDDAVRIFNIREVSVPVEIPVEKINTLDWHENGQYLAGAATDGTIYVWDVSALMGG